MQLMLWPKRESPVTVNHCRRQPGKSWSSRSRQSVGQQLPNGLNHCHNSLPLLFLDNWQTLSCLVFLSIHPSLPGLHWHFHNPNLLSSSYFFRLSSALLVLCATCHLFWLFLDALPLPTLATIHAIPSHILVSAASTDKYTFLIHPWACPRVADSCATRCCLCPWNYGPSSRAPGPQVLPFLAPFPLAVSHSTNPVLLFSHWHIIPATAPSLDGLVPDSPQSFTSSSCSLDFASLPSASLPTRDRAVSATNPQPLRLRFNTLFFCRCTCPRYNDYLLLECFMNMD